MKSEHHTLNSLNGICLDCAIENPLGKFYGDKTAKRCGSHISTVDKNGVIHIWEAGPRLGVCSLHPWN